MNAASLLSVSWKETGQSVLQSLLVQPLRGFGEILRGLALAGPELARAAGAAAVAAVRQQLGTEGQAKVRQGIDQVLAGVPALAVPLIVALAIWICWSPTIVFLCSVVWVFGLAMCLTVD